VDLLAARVVVLARFGQHWHAWKDYGFLLQLAHDKLYGLGSQESAFKTEIEKHLNACSHQKVLGLPKNAHLPHDKRAVQKMINKRKTKYHGDKNDSQEWCHYFSIRLDKILDSYSNPEDSY